LVFQKTVQRERELVYVIVVVFTTDCKKRCKIISGKLVMKQLTQLKIKYIKRVLYLETEVVHYSNKLKG
jgi:hypothetical protein